MLRRFTLVSTLFAVVAVLIAAPGTAAALPHPYVSATGGDVLAGSSFATDGVTCDGPHVTTAGIVGWNNNGSPNYNGAGTQYAAFALNYIQSFVTGGQTTQLSFANIGYTPTPPAPAGPNSVNPAGGLFGGMFGSAPCFDFWNSKPATASVITATDMNVSTLASGSYSRTGNITLGGAIVPAGRHITLYVKGDVAITGNITLPPGVTYGDRMDIPSFRLIVQGTIYIDKSILLLDGLYAAIPAPGETTKMNQFASPNAGTISTCSTGFRSYDPTKVLTTDASMSTDCAEQLIVNGSFVAQQVWLLRGYGDVGGNAAEQFNYVPEVWLAPSGGGSSGASAASSTNYQSVIGLPPNL